MRVSQSIYAVCTIRGRRYFVKALLSTLLGLMLLTSLVGITYATPVMQPTQNNGGDINACVNLTPNNPNYIALGCAGAAHQNGNENPPPHQTCIDQKAPDSVCCPYGIAPNSLQVSDNQNTRLSKPSLSNVALSDIRYQLRISLLSIPLQWTLGALRAAKYSC